MTTSHFDDLITKINDYGYYNDLLSNEKTVNDIINDPDITKLQELVNREIETILTKSSLTKSSHNNTFINKPDILTTDDMAYLQKHIIDKVNLIKTMVPRLSIADLRDVHNYLSILLKHADNTQNPSSCDIVSIYIKYSHLVHLLVAFYDRTIISIDDQDMFKDRNLEISENYIFTKCLSSVNTIMYLLGKNTKNYMISIKSQSLKDLITSSKQVPSYYVTIGVNASLNPGDNNTFASDLGHIFVIIKYQDNDGQDYYYLAQSYFYKYCPKIKKYNLHEILKMIDDITSIYFNADGTPRTGNWTQYDNNIWLKYFLSDENKSIGKHLLNNKSIKIPHWWKNYKNWKDYCYCFDYDYNVIDIDACYENMNVLLKSTENDVVKCFDNICRSILNACEIYTYERPYIIEAVKNDKFAKVDHIPTVRNTYVDVLNVDDSVLEKYNISRKNITANEIINNYPIRSQWSQFKTQLTKQNVMFIIDKFYINSYKELILFLSILVQFFDLKDEVTKKRKNYGSNSRFVVNEHFGGGSQVGLTHYNKYIENKMNYLRIK